MSAEPVAAELVERRVILPDQRIDAFHAPAIAVSARAGQVLQVLLADDEGLVVRRAFAINTVDPSTGVISVHVAGPARADALARLRVGDRAPLAGPFGRPFEVDPRTTHILLIAEGAAIGRLRLLADEALREGRQVTVLLGAQSARDVYPSTLLPDEVEYVVATVDGSLGHPGSVADLVPQYEAWADQAFAAGSPALLGKLAALSASRLTRMGVAKLGRRRGAAKVDPPGSPSARRKSFLQVVVELDVACAAATCLGCVVDGHAGLLRACREGPVFAATELSLETVA